MERGNENLREQFLANGDRGGHASLDSDLSSSPGRRNTPKYDTRKHFSPLFPRPSPPMRAASHEKKSPPSSWRLPVALMAAGGMMTGRGSCGASKCRGGPSSEAVEEAHILYSQ